MNESEYCKELKNLIKHAHSIFNGNKLNVSKTQLKSHRYMFSASYIDKIDQDNICGLYLFMRKHPELSEKQIKSLVVKNFIAFKSLYFLIENVKDLIPSLKQFGFKQTCLNIVKDRMLPFDNSND